MNRSVSVFLLVIACMMGLNISCRHGCVRPGGTSRHGDDESHNMGLNCLNCHSGTGTGEGCFAVGGTVYGKSGQDVYPGCTIELYADSVHSGAPVFALENDRNGNFYTGNDVSFGKGLFPVVRSPEGKREEMLEPISNGACNSCHGATTDRIIVH